MTVAGAQQGISAIYVDAANAAPCQQFTTTPTVNQDGTVSVPIDDFRGTASLPDRRHRDRRRGRKRGAVRLRSTTLPIPA